MVNLANQRSQHQVVGYYTGSLGRVYFHASCKRKTAALVSTHTLQCGTQLAFAVDEGKGTPSLLREKLTQVYMFTDNQKKLALDLRPVRPRMVFRQTVNKVHQNM